MKFDECAKLFEMDVGGSNRYPHMVHGRNPDMSQSPEEKVRMLESIVKEKIAVRATYDGGLLFMSVVGVVMQEGANYVIRSGGADNLSMAHFGIGDIKVVMSHTNETVDSTPFTIILRAGE